MLPLHTTTTSERRRRERADAIAGFIIRAGVVAAIFVVLSAFAAFAFLVYLGLSRFWP